MYDNAGDFEIDEAAAAQGRRSPSESGIARWTTGEAIPTFFNVSDPTSYSAMKLVARLENAKPVPLALHVNVSAEGATFDASAMANQSTFLFGPGLVLIIDYGDLSGQHRLLADARSGTYRLPACTFAQVYALQYNSLAGLAFALNIGCTLSRMLDSEPKPYTFTFGGDLAAAATIGVHIPPYAQFVDLWASGWVGGIGAANAPILRAEDLGLYRDYTTGLFVPPWGPISYNGDGVSTETVDIENAGPATARVFLQFYLAP